MKARQLAVRVVHEIGADDVFGQAAKLSYYFVLALFPLLLVVVTLLGYMTQSSGEFMRTLLSYWRQVMPRSAYQLVVSTLDEVRANAGSDKLSIGIIGTLWAASNGMSAIMGGLNRAYEVKEGRPWWRAQIVAVVLTIALAAFIIAALGIVLYGNRIGELAATYVGLRSFFDNAWSIVQWPIVLVFVLTAFTLLYRFAPDLHGLEWRRTMPGAVIAVVLWLGVSLALRIYLHFFNHYTATYGSLGAMIILMLWFYLMGVAILIGGEVNSELENAAAREGDREARLPGEKHPGEKRARKTG